MDLLKKIKNLILKIFFNEDSKIFLYFFEEDFKVFENFISEFENDEELLEITIYYLFFLEKSKRLDKFTYSEKSKNILLDTNKFKEMKIREKFIEKLKLNKRI